MQAKHLISNFYFLILLAKKNTNVDKKKNIFPVELDEKFIRIDWRKKRQKKENRIIIWIINNY